MLSCVSGFPQVCNRSWPVSSEKHFTLIRERGETSCPLAPSNRHTTTQNPVCPDYWRKPLDKSSPIQNNKTTACKHTYIIRQIVQRSAHNNVIEQSILKLCIYKHFYILCIFLYVYIQLYKFSLSLAGYYASWLSMLVNTDFRLLLYFFFSSCG